MAEFKPPEDDGPLYLVGRDGVAEGMRFVDMRIPVDTNTYRRCVFERVTFIYAATGRFELTDSLLDRVRYVFVGPAREVVLRLQEVYHSSPGAASRVEVLFDRLRRHMDFHVAARLASREHFSSVYADRVFEFLMEMYRDTGGRSGPIETIFADVRAGDVIRSTEEEIRADEAEDRRAAAAESQRLRISVTHPESADPDLISAGLVDLVRALNAYHLASGGTGLVVDDTRGLGAAPVEAGVTA